MKKAIYISGPITDNTTGLPREGWQEDFVRAEEHLRELGFDVVNPVLLSKVADTEWAVRSANDVSLPDATPRWFYLQTCLDTLCEAMQAGNLAGIYLLGVKQPVRYSYGVRAEIYMAKSMNLPLFMEFYDGNETDEHLLPVKNGLRLAEGGEFVHENWSE